MVLNRSFFLAFVLLIVGCGKPQEQAMLSDASRNDLHLLYDNVFKKTDVESLRTDPKLYVWNTSLVMQSLVTMFESTGKVVYLEKLAVLAPTVLQNRADRAGTPDINGNLRKAWLNSVDQEKYFGYLVGTGMVVYPMLKFASIVESTPSLYARFGGLAHKIRKDTLEAMQSFEADWDETEGVYRFSKDDPDGFNAGEIVPINQYLAMARAFLYLPNDAASAPYRARGKRMAERFKASLKLREDTNSYTWGYWPEVHGGTEDTSHGAIDADFVAESFKTGQSVFTEEDVQRFSNTLEKHVMTNSDFAYDVNGNGVAKVPQAVGHWATLGYSETGTAEALKSYYTSLSGDLTVPRAHYVLQGIAAVLSGSNR
jgi:hypothetical protein